MAIKIRGGGLEPVGRWKDPIGIADAQGFETFLCCPKKLPHPELTEDTHFDPFDRMLIWQAIKRDLVLVSGDKQFERFKADGLRLLWKQGDLERALRNPRGFTNGLRACLETSRIIT